MIEICLQIFYDIEGDAKDCCNKNSVLFKHSFRSLCEFSWDSIIEELLTKQPFLADILLPVALPAGKIGNKKATESVLPVIGAVYGILLKQRYHELSANQKVVAMTLANEQAHQKVTVLSITL